MATSPSEIRSTVTLFVDRYDLQPHNGVAEIIPDCVLSEALIDRYVQEVLGSLSSDTSLENRNNFHRANAVFFQYLPPQRRIAVFDWINRGCTRFLSDAPSSLCRQRPDLAQIKRDYGCREEPLPSVPAITATRTPVIYARLQWLISATREEGLNEFSRELASMLRSKKIRYQDEPYEGDNPYGNYNLVANTIFLSAKFFEGTWGWLIRKTEIGCTPEEARKALGLPPGFASDVQIQAVQEAERNFWEERFKRYFGDTAKDSFPADLPLWVIMLPHEVRHYQQYAELRSTGRPKWIEPSGVDDPQYYELLKLWVGEREREYSGIVCRRDYTMNDPVVSSLPSEVATQQQRISDALEHEATVYGSQVAKAIASRWLKRRPK